MLTVVRRPMYRRLHRRRTWRRRKPRVRRRGGESARGVRRSEMQLQEAQVAADAAEEAAWASPLEQEEEAGPAREQEELADDCLPTWRSWTTTEVSTSQTTVCCRYSITIVGEIVPPFNLEHQGLATCRFTNKTQLSSANVPLGGVVALIVHDGSHLNVNVH